MNDLRAHFRPEFLNRLDEIIMFKPLTKSNIHAIIDLLVKDVNKRLADKELSIELTDAAKNFVVEGGYDPMYGARPLKRYLQKNVETLAAKLILAGDVGRGDRIEIDVVDGKLEAKVKGQNRRMTPVIFHIDVNSAYLSWTAVEQLKNGAGTDLRMIPSIIGGDQKSRHGVVLAKSIPAKDMASAQGNLLRMPFVSVRIW